MTGISRIDKYIVETANLASIKESQQLRTIPVNIVLSPDKTGKVAMMCLTVLGLAIRSLKGPIRIYFPQGDIAPLPCSPSSLKELIEQEAARAEAISRVEFRNDIPGKCPTIAIGCDIKGAYIADCAGWWAYIKTRAPQGIAQLPASPPAAVFAASLTFAKFFKAHVLKDLRYDDEQWQFSLLHFEKNSPYGDDTTVQDVDIGKITLLGAGAIGSGFAFTLWLSDYAADLLIIDKGRYEEPNFETTMLISKSDELQMRWKAECLSANLSGRKGLIARYLRENVGKRSKVLQTNCDMLICGVDDSETRRQLDDANVKILINGGIGGRKEDAGHILFSRHTGSDPPLSELYPLVTERDLESDVAVPEEFKDACSRVPYLNTTMAAPFLGTATGALLAAACAQRVLGVKIGLNYIKFDVLKFQKSYQHAIRRAK